MNITYRKVFYISVIVVLLFPLFMLGQPATHQAGEGGTSGGRLAQLRSEYDLSQAELGEIDPASESMKLATLGMRGVAANILWTKAIEYRKTQQWDKLSATLNQITKLQPNFIHVWESQAHNLSYNVSVEFDNYEHRYQWVKRGIYYLIDGIQYNRRAPRLTHSVGWFVSQKIGRADERVQFRRLFREDRDFHNDLASHINMDGPDVRGADEYPDNWLVGRQWYLAAYDQTEEEGVPVQGTSPLLFYSSAPMNRFNFADTITEEGYLDERSAEAWRTGEREWLEYGNREIPTSWGHNVRLERQEELRQEADRLRRELEELLPGLMEELRAENVANLPDELREAYETPEEERTEQQHYAAFQALNRLRTRYIEVADRAPSDVRPRARGIARRIDELLLRADRTGHYRSIVNYEYWRTLARVEQQQIALDARRHLYEADQYRERAELQQARENYEAAWDHWAEIFEQYPQLMGEVFARDLVEAVERYNFVLGQLDEPFPADFKLMPLLELHYHELAQHGQNGLPETHESPPGHDASREEPTDPGTDPSGE